MADGAGSCSAGSWRYRRKRRRVAVIAGFVALGLGVAACSSGGTGNSSSSKPPHTSAAPGANTQSASAPGTGAPGSAGTVSLASVCPDPVKVVENWTPEAEQGAVYQLAGNGGTVDSKNKTYTAPLVDNGKDTGVKIEIIAGGPAIGYMQPPEYLYTNTDVLLAVGSLDQVIADYAKVPTIGVVAPLRINPQILMWNPAKLHISSLKDVANSGAPVLYFQGATYMDYLIGAGYVKQSQADGSYKGDPSRWVGSGGNVVEQGFATAEPYIYTHELSAWNKPVAYALIANSGYNAYQDIEARPENVTKYKDCLTKLVPIIQRAQIAYVKSPDRVNQLIVQLIGKYGIGGPYDANLAAYAVDTMLKDKIVSDPPGGEGFGGFDMANVKKLVDTLGPILAKGGKAIPSDLTPDKIATNQFIDNSIHLGYTGPFNDTEGVVTVSP